MAWRHYPCAMLAATLARFRHEFLALRIQPIDTLGALMVYLEPALLAQRLRRRSHKEGR
jgi:hypothetical protein